MEKYEISPEMISKIIDILKSGNRVELIPTKSGIKVIEESRREIK